MSILFTNARIVGRDSSDTFSVLVQDGRVKSITASNAPTEEGDAEKIDLSGLWLSPSFVDHHTHFTQWAQTLQRLDLTKTQSAQECCDLVKAKLDAAHELTGHDEPVIGFGWMVGSWPDIERMTKETLDALSTDRMIVLLARDIHSMWCNSAALSYFGYDPAQETGILREKSCFDAIGKLPAVKDEILDEWVEVAAKDAARKGVTEIVDLEMAHNLAIWKRRMQEKNFDILRVRFGMYREHIEDAISVGLKSGDGIEGCPLLTVGPFKIITDGSLGTRTAYCHEPYPGTQDYGEFIYPKETLQSMMQHGAKNGLTLAVHAIGDKANGLTIKAFESLDKVPAGSSIEHAQLLSWEDIPLFASLGLIASVQPEHANGDRALCERFWPGREDRAYPFRTMLDQGVTLKLGSDAPVSQLDPGMQIAAAVSRAWEEGPSEVWHPEQVISNLEAFVASTSGGRATVSEDDVADLIVLESNPLECTGRELRRLQVKATMLQGRFTHRDL